MLADRVRVMVTKILQGSYTKVGIALWFNRKRPAGLGGLTPNEALDSGDTQLILKVFSLARRLQQ